MRPTRTTPPLLALALLGACRMPIDLSGFTSASLTAPSDAPLELEFEGERLATARVPAVPASLPPALQAAADRERPGERTTQAFREWGAHGQAWRLVRQRDGEELARELLLTENGAILEEVHPVPTDRIPPEVVAAATARGLLRVQHAAIVRSELRPHHWRFACEDGAGRPHRVQSDLTGGDVRIARIAHARSTAW